MELFTGWQREVLGRTVGDVEEEHVLVPGLVEALVDVERTPVDMAEQEVDIAEDCLLYTSDAADE